MTFFSLIFVAFFPWFIAGSKYETIAIDRSRLYFQFLVI